MKIAIVSNPYVDVPPVRYGGIEQVVYLLTEGLINRGHKICLYATGKSKTSGSLKYLYPEAIWPIDYRIGADHYSFAFTDILHRKDFDVIHVHDALALPFTRFLNDIPCVLTIHHVKDDYISMIYNHFQNVHYITISDYQRRKEVPLKYGKTIYHGLETKHFPCSLEHENYYAFLGRISKVKGLHNAIKAALATENELRIGGPVHWVDEEYFNREIKPYLNNRLIKYLGNLDLREKANLLRKAKATIFPIEWDEPFGLVMVESMLCGTPVIAFPKGSVNEIVQEGITGYIVNNLDELIALMKSDRLEAFDRKRCADIARERFNSDRFISEYESYYKDLVH
jgi:glycosyltransferase involved in cell wall biosynthesis